MNEDEAFIRAIVDNRGDDTARLIYADWLDDRADPRGPYLRAEYEWVKSGKKEKALGAMATTLDPVWVARVSRPPVGICADKLVMRTKHAPATAADLDAVEAELKVKLPAEYRALLMNWNGASPSINVPPQPRHRYIAELQSFLHVMPVGKKRTGNYDPPHWDLIAAARRYLDPEFLFQYGQTTNSLTDYVPLANSWESDFYMIGVRGKVVGKVGFFSDFTHNAGDPSRLCKASPSLGRLLASLIEAAPEWYRLIKNRDTDGLLAWLDAGGDVNARCVYPWSDKSQVLSEVIDMNNLSLVRELVARGANVTRECRRKLEFVSESLREKMRAALDAAKAPAKKGKKK